MSTNAITRNVPKVPHALWTKLQEALTTHTVLHGKVVRAFKGGYNVAWNGILVFVPASLIDIRPTHDMHCYLQKSFDFHVLKLVEGESIVFGRRSVMEEELQCERLKLRPQLVEGHVMQGIVKNITDYGVFVDIGGIDGLVSKPELTWSKCKHASEVVQVGQEVSVKIMKVHTDSLKIDLSIKETLEHPWDAFSALHMQGQITKARVTAVVDYGCFLEVYPGVEGLLHKSTWSVEMVIPKKGEYLTVRIGDIQWDKRRVALMPV